MRKITEIFGELTFNESVMKDKLSTDVLAKLKDSLSGNRPLDESIAGEVAHAMKEWAIANGATHFTHWFQPMRGGTAEKHDAFISYTEDGRLIERFSAKQLIQSEPDASSFPSGGIRSTFEARGYTAWDPTSPAFLIETGSTKTLVIPSVFLSYTGEVLDRKTPLLRSLHALSVSGVRLQKLLGNRFAKKIIVYTGPEQEYFVVSRELCKTRPDLAICGRTLFGAAPAKGQQLEDHYFGAIGTKMVRFMEDLDHELYRRGIPAKTRHNEVSPNQFEIAPLYEEANLAVDHNMQLMDVMKKVGERHDLVVLLHEKPFAGLNGSGKHVNWSIGDNTGSNYLVPSGSPLKNLSFLLTLGALLLGVEKYGGLLRACVADAGNDYRLGGHEAPPAIVSLYLGEHLSELLDEIEGITKPTEKILADINMGVKNLPRILKDSSDRNRTSPMAFTGDKFEFRAVGSSQNCSEAVTIMNMLVAFGFNEIHDRLEKAGDPDIRKSVILVMKDICKITKKIRFEGNGYSKEWHKEALKRGLPEANNTPEALKLFLSPDSVALHKELGILSERELHAKVEIKIDNYIKVKEVEYAVAADMARTLIMPSLTAFVRSLAETAGCVPSGIAADALREDLNVAQSLYLELRAALIALEAFIESSKSISDPMKQAESIASKGETALRNLRSAIDRAEKTVPAELWKIAKYQDLLASL